MFEEYGDDRNDEWEKLKNGTLVHRTALVAPWVRFDNECLVYPYAIVGREPSESLALARHPRVIRTLKIGSRSIIGCHSVVYSDVVIGSDCLIGDHALVREGTRIGNRCVVGCHVSISYDSQIGDRNRFQNSSVFIGQCGNDCFFGVGVICSSDNLIDLSDYKYNSFTPPIFGNKVMVGSGANILPGVVVEDEGVIGAGAVVTKYVKTGTLVLGPAAKERIKINSDSELSHISV